jgi:hypothetical protein
MLHLPITPQKMYVFNDKKLSDCLFYAMRVASHGDYIVPTVLLTILVDIIKISGVDLLCNL